MPRIVPARIVTPTGDRIDGDVANLTVTGLFFRTEAALRFGQSVTVKLLGQTMPGQVLFVASEPEGAVLSLRPSTEAAEALAKVAHEVACVDGLRKSDDGGLWSEDSQATIVGMEPEPAKIDTGDLHVVPETSPEPKIEIDAGLLAAASRDDESHDIPILDPEEHPPEPQMASPRTPLSRASTPVPPRAGSISRSPLPRSSSAGLPPATPAGGTARPSALSGVGLPAASGQRRGPLSRTPSHGGLPAPSGPSAPARSSSGAGLPPPSRGTSGVGLPAPSGSSSPADASPGAGRTAPARSSSGTGRLPPARSSSGAGLPPPARSSSGAGLPPPARSSSGAGLPPPSSSGTGLPAPARSSSGAGLPAPARASSGAGLPAPSRGSSGVGRPAASGPSAPAVGGVEAPSRPSAPARATSQAGSGASSRAGMLARSAVESPPAFEAPPRPPAPSGADVPLTVAGPGDVLIPPPPADTNPRLLADDLMSPAGPRSGEWVQDTEVPSDPAPHDMLAEPLHPSNESTDSESARAPAVDMEDSPIHVRPVGPDSSTDGTEDLASFVDEPTADEVQSSASSGTDDIPIDIDVDMDLDDEAPAQAEPEPLAPPRPESGGLQLVASSEEAAPPSTDDSLPTLDRDGYTVRFASPGAYSVQYRANIEHGGLVVRADALPLGTQRMLALEVPGRPAYTVSARVIYHQDGKLGFMLDSFSLHKSHLKRLAQAS